MTLAPIAAAFSAWAILGERMSLQAVVGMLVTISGIGLSVLNKGGGKHRLSLKLPLKGVLFGIGAGIGQGVGLVLSKVGMNHYEQSIPAGEELVADLMPFASTMIRAITGFIGFFLVMIFQKKLATMSVALRNRKGMNAAVWATFAGPFIGVSLSLMAVQYTEAGIASTLMALTPIFILWPSSFFFGQKVTTKEIAGAVISVVGVSLFFL
jgi:drug/metabolite transporter (DMT)-like permease